MAAVSGSPSPAPVDEFAIRVKGAQERIDESLIRSGLQRDAYRFPIEALSFVVGLFPEFVTRLEATRPALAEKEIQRLGRDAARGAAGEVIRVAGAINRRTSLAAGGILFLTAAIAGGAGWWFGQSREAARYVNIPAQFNVALTGPDAAQWLNLIRLNVISRTQQVCAPQAGGMACSISFWTKPPTAAAK